MTTFLNPFMAKITYPNLLMTTSMTGYAIGGPVRGRTGVGNLTGYGVGGPPLARTSMGNMTAYALTGPAKERLHVGNIVAYMIRNDT